MGRKIRVYVGHIEHEEDARAFAIYLAVKQLDLAGDTPLQYAPVRVAERLLSTMDAFNFKPSILAVSIQN